MQKVSNSIYYTSDIAGVAHIKMFDCLSIQQAETVFNHKNLTTFQIRFQIKTIAFLIEKNRS